MHCDALEKVCPHSRMCKIGRALNGSLPCKAGIEAMAMILKEPGNTIDELVDAADWIAAETDLHPQTVWVAAVAFAKI